MDWTEDYYHVPTVCSKCGGVMVYKGVGEYVCEKCGQKDMDDYGKVRNYIETHGTATSAEIQNALGISSRTIRQMLKDSRIEVTANSSSFMHCELCGKPIRCGRFCNECEAKMHRNLENKTRKNIQGYGILQNADDGKKRFSRDR